MLSYSISVIGSFDRGSLVIKSIVTDCYSFLNFSIVCGTLLTCVLCLFFWQFSYCWMKLATCFFMLSK